MSHRIFLAGAAGAIGRRLAPLLRDAGHHVTGTTRSKARAEDLRAQGVEPVLLDIFDVGAVRDALAAARPDIVIHQLTDLPAGLDPTRMAAAVAANARIRREGTKHLIEAAIAAGATRMIAQSIAWAYAPGAHPHQENDPLDAEASGDRGISVGGVIALETAVLQSPLAGIVLRYGRLYGSGTGVDTRPESMPLHVDAAAYAALLAIDHPGSAIFNIAEPNGEVATEKAVRDLGWDADFRLAWTI